MPRLLLSVLWSEFSRKENGEREMEFLLDDDTEEILEASQRLLKRRCGKHPGHEQFLPVTKLRMDHLPPFWRRPSQMEVITKEIRGTAKLTVGYTSPQRPDSLSFKALKGSRSVRVGSGYMHDIDNIETIIQTQPCPIKTCSFSRSHHRVSAFFSIMTAAHVIFDDSEAEKTTIEFFYDDDTDKASIVKAQGVEVETRDVEGDRCMLACVTHEFEKLYYKLTQPVQLPRRDGHTRPTAPYSPLGYVISHPQGCSKMISFGELKDMETSRDFTSEEIRESFISTGHTDLIPSVLRRCLCKSKYDIPTCPGSSGGPVNVVRITDGRLQGHVAPHSRHIMDENVNESGIGHLIDLNL